MKDQIGNGWAITVKLGPMKAWDLMPDKRNKAFIFIGEIPNVSFDKDRRGNPYNEHLFLCIPKLCILFLCIQAVFIPFSVYTSCLLTSSVYARCLWRVLST